LLQPAMASAPMHSVIVKSRAAGVRRNDVVI
jgi:hypothetical protein